MFEVVFVAGMSHLAELHLIGAVPLAILRSHGIGDGTFREVLHGAVSGRDGSAGSEVEVYGHLRQFRQQAHSEHQLLLSRRHIGNVHVAFLTEIASIFIAHPCFQNVAFGIGSLVLEARSQCQANKSQEGWKQYSTMHFYFLIACFVYIQAAKLQKNPQKYIFLADKLTKASIFLCERTQFNVCRNIVDACF